MSSEWASLMAGPRLRPNVAAETKFIGFVRLPALLNAIMVSSTLLSVVARRCGRVLEKRGYGAFLRVTSAHSVTLIVTLTDADQCPREGHSP